MLEATKPEAVSVMGPIRDHVAAVEACAPRGVHLLAEKPPGFSKDDAARIKAASRRRGALVLTNFETSRYASVRVVGRPADSGERADVSGARAR